MKALPDRPDIRYLAREAKALKSRHRRGDPGVCEAVGHFDTSLHGLTDRQILERRFSILDAQRVVARRYGFASWTKLIRHVEACVAGRNPRDPSLGRHVARKEKLYFLAANALYDAGFQRRLLGLLEDAVSRGAFWDYNRAMLVDRYLALTGRPVLYGIPFDCSRDEDGVVRVYVGAIADPANPEERRAISGYGPYGSQCAELVRMAEEDDWTLPTRRAVEDRFARLSVAGGYVR